ncbi:MAG: hypothetical protein KatS3mg001_064 [Candidatus Pacearchaeota archaeon]|nr:MAG: hypothetical protein KatS3mg001_064 [Candidatus Pacearchaeota archaeon]
MREKIYVVPIIVRSFDGRILVVKKEGSLELPLWVFDFKENPVDFLKRRLNEEFYGSFIVRYFLGENSSIIGKDNLERIIAYRVDCKTHDVYNKKSFNLFYRDFVWADRTNLIKLRELLKEERFLEFV